jgi:hypothetical protein
VPEEVTEMAPFKGLTYMKSDGLKNLLAVSSYPIYVKTGVCVAHVMLAENGTITKVLASPEKYSKVFFVWTTEFSLKGPFVAEHVESIFVILVGS